MAGFRAKGTKVTIKKVGSEPNDLVLKNLTSIGEQTTEIEEIDVTDHDSQGKEYIAGDRDAGSLDLSGNIKDSAQIEKLQAIFDAGKNRQFEIEYPSGDKLTFEAYISKFGFGEAATDSIYAFSATLRISGKPTFTKHA